MFGGQALGSLKAPTDSPDCNRCWVSRVQKAAAHVVLNPPQQTHVGRPTADLTIKTCSLLLEPSSSNPVWPRRRSRTHCSPIVEPPPELPQNGESPSTFKKLLKTQLFGEQLLSEQLFSSSLPSPLCIPTAPPPQSSALLVGSSTGTRYFRTLKQYFSRLHHMTSKSFWPSIRIE